MALTIWTFSPGGDTATEGELQKVRDTVRSCAPVGSRIQVRGVDQHFMLFDVDADAERPVFGDELDNDHQARIAATIWLPDDLEDPEARAVEAIDRLHRQVPEPLASVVCDTQVHLDLTETAGAPTAHVVIRLTRAHDKTRDESVSHYRTHHVPMAKSLEPLYTRYSTHRVLHVRGDFAEDGLTVQEFPSRDHLTRHVQKRFEPDDESFKDLANFLSKVDFYTGDHALL